MLLCRLHVIENVTTSRPNEVVSYHGISNIFFQMDSRGVRFRKTFRRQISQRDRIV